MTLYAVTYVCLSRTRDLSQALHCSFSDSLPHVYGRIAPQMVETATSSAIILFMSVMAVDHTQRAVTILAPLVPGRGNRNRRGDEVYLGSSVEARRAE